MLDSDPDMKERIRRAVARRFSQPVADGVTLQKMGGHASLRIYWRVELPASGWELDEISGESTLVAMVLDPEHNPAKSAEGPDDEELEVEQLPFVDVQRYLAGIGMPVPAIEHVDRQDGVLLLEDLGDTTFEDQCLEVLEDGDLSAANRLSESSALYRQALDLIVELQRALLDSRQTEGSSIVDESICWRRRFDAETLRWELDHFVEWGVEERFGPHVLDEEQRATLDRLFDELVDELLGLEQLVALRDFQSRNLMYKPSEERGSPWVLIDFQDALVAPYIYDVVALLRDSYIELPPDQVSELLDYYVEAGAEADLPWCEDGEAVRRAFHLQTVQRKLKDAGRFIFIDRQKGNSDFLDYFEPSLGYVDHALEQLPGWDELQNILHALS